MSSLERKSVENSMIRLFNRVVSLPLFSCQHFCVAAQNFKAKISQSRKRPVAQRSSVLGTQNSCEAQQDAAKGIVTSEKHFDKYSIFTFLTVSIFTLFSFYKTNQPNKTTTNKTNQLPELPKKSSFFKTCDISMQ